MALFLDAHHFLNLRLGLQHEVFRRTAAQNEHAGFVAAGFRFVNDRRPSGSRRGSRPSISFESRMAIAATFMPIELSPGLLVKMGMPHS